MGFSQLSHIVDFLVSAVVGNDNVPMDPSPCHLSRGLACSHICQKGLAIPTIDRPMIRALTASVEKHVLCHVVAAPKPVVEVDACTGEIEDHVASYHRLRSLCLEDGGALLLPNPDLTKQIAGDGSPSREHAACAIDTQFATLR